MNNQSGQATTAALVILPVALMAFCGALISIGALTLEAKATAACRVSMVESQNEAAASLADLLSLNATAARLEQSRQAAKAALATALLTANPAVIASARAAVQAVEQLQAPVIVKQKAALIRGRYASFSAHRKAESAIRSSLPATLRPSMPNSVTKTARFNVIATPPGARTPTYRTAPGFNRSQEAKVRWLLDEPSVAIGCAVTLDKTEGGQWRPKITEDKLLPN